jgi:D-tyrosyl-tRNA(Tyr) deacylase
MRVLVQRVSQARVSVGGETCGAIGRGVLALVGVSAGDDGADIEWLVHKTLALRIFDDDAGVMNRALPDVGGDLLAVSQFTLYASTRNGNRPSYSAAAAPTLAEPLFRRFVDEAQRQLGKPVPTGRFGANMQVELTNDGPVTIMLDSKARD